MKLLYEVYKNFKLIFRNWATLFLVVLAPLILILLVGYSYSGENLHDIRIGAIAEPSMNLDGLAQNISAYAVLERYDSLESCLLDVSTGRTHMCLEFSGDFLTQKIPTGNLTFYYDNSRKRVSLSLLSEMKDFFGLTSEKISLISVQEIFGNIQNLVDFINERIGEIDIVKNESVQIKSDLLQRKQQLIEFQKDFTPKYVAVKTVQSGLNQYIESFNQSTNDLMDSLANLKVASAALKSQLNSFSNLSAQHQALLAAIYNLEYAMASVEESANATRNEVLKIKASVDSVVFELDLLDKLIADEIRRSDDYIARIDKAIARVDDISSQAKNKMKAFSEYDPSLASKLVRPITQIFETILKGLTDVQAAFPLLLSAVIIFVSILFSNIITLQEINSIAYVRNILAPVSDRVFTAGMIITNFIVISVQVIVLLVVAQTQFGIDILGNLADVVRVSVLLTLIFICVGMIVAYLSNNMQTSILMSTFVALTFFLFSDAINSLEVMPKIASVFASLNPLVVANAMFRQVFFFGINAKQMQAQMFILVAYLAVAMFALLKVSERKNKQRI
jgi:ABC-type multidrug transport system permease subunit